MRLPEIGKPKAEILNELSGRGQSDVDWRDGKTAVYIFNAGPEVGELKKSAYTQYMEENGLGPLAFPSLKRMEEEVISMALNLLNAPEGAAGAMTSGGTDSITMALKTARDFARAERLCD